MIEILVETTVYGGLIPFAVAVGLFLFILRLGGPRNALADRVGGALALAAGFFAGDAALGFAPFAPLDAWHWLPYLGLLAAIPIAFAARPSFTDSPRVAARFISSFSAPLLIAAVAAVAAWMLVPDWPSLADSHWLWRLVLFVLIVSLWTILDKTSTRQPPAPLLGQLFLVAVTGSLVLELSGNLKFAQLAGVLAATVAGCGLVAWRRPLPDIARGVVPGFAVLLVGLLFTGYFYSASNVPLASFVLVAAAPIVIGANAVPFISKRLARRTTIIRMAIMLMILGMAVLLAALA